MNQLCQIKGSVAAGGVSNNIGNACDRTASRPEGAHRFA